MQTRLRYHFLRQLVWFCTTCIGESFPGLFMNSGICGYKVSLKILDWEDYYSFFDWISVFLRPLTMKILNCNYLLINSSRKNPADFAVQENGNNSWKQLSLRSAAFWWSQLIRIHTSFHTQAESNCVTGLTENQKFIECKQPIMYSVRAYLSLLIFVVCW